MMTRALIAFAEIVVVYACARNVRRRRDIASVLLFAGALGSLLIDLAASVPLMPAFARLAPQTVGNYFGILNMVAVIPAVVFAVSLLRVLGDRRESRPESPA